MTSVKVEDRGANKSSWHFVVSETIIPVDVSESIKEIVWWKRYSDFQTLHKTLSALHAALYLKGSFPFFPKPVVLRRHEEHVIQERRQASERLLNFISEYPILCRHEVVKDFLKDGEEVCCSTDCDPTEVLRPNKLYVSEDPGDCVDDLLTDADSCSSDAGKCRAECLSPVAGIWQHRQEDQLTPDSSPIDDDPNYAQLVIPTSDSQEGGALSPIDTEGELCVDDTTSEMSPKKANAMVVSTDHSRLLDMAGESNGSVNAGKSNVPEEDYLFMAGHHLARATDKELAGEFEVSFGLYKLGIDILLNGVQTDKDPVRRDAVRRKAAKYLAKAEELYNQHITGSINDKMEPLIHSEYSTAAGTRAELAEYTILSVLAENVSLVMHRTSHETLVLKVLSKSPTSSTAGKRRDRRTIIPLGPQRHMVQLRRFIETDDAVYLVLERAPGGRLSDYISRSSSVEEGRLGLHKTNSASSELSRTSSSDFSASWRKLVVTMTTNDDEDGGGDYADLFFKHAVDSDRSRTSSLATVDRPTFSTFASVESACPEEDSRLSVSQLKGQGDEWTPDCLLDSVDLTDILRKSGSEEIGAHSDIEFLQSVEPSASPTLKGLSNWRDVSELDSDQLVAKSKELLQSLDKTIKLSHDALPTPQQRSRSRSASPRPPPLDLSGATSNPVAISKDDTVDQAFKEDSDALLSDTTPLKKMPETLVRIWAAELIVAVEALHELGIICVDLELHNVLLGEKGHIKLTYFSQWTSVIRTFQASKSACAYHIAPELRKVGEEPTAVCDTWSIGVIIFELLSGKKFETLNVVKPHTHRSLLLPADISREAGDLLFKMLKFSPRERLTLPEVRQHPLFQNVDWRRIENCL